MKTALTIAGSDCSGGAGIQADIKTMSAVGVYAMSVITSIVAENTVGVISCEDVSEKIVSDQLDAVFKDISVDAVKVGMLPSLCCMQVVARKLKEYAPKIVIIDPVLKATDGTPLMKEPNGFVEAILPLATLITPNIPEAEWLTGIKIASYEDIGKAARRLVDMGAKAALIKGGHLVGDAVDTLYDGKRFFTYSHGRLNSTSTHGTGCTLSSAITAYMALGLDISHAVEKAKQYITGAIENGPKIGHGNGPTNHFFEFYDQNGEKR